MISAIDSLFLIASANPLAHLLSAQNTWAAVFGILLLGVSLFIWSVIASKTVALRRSSKNDKIFLQHFRESAHPLQVYAANAKSDGSVLHEVYNSGARELTYHWLGSSEVDDTFEARLHRASAMSQRESSLFRTRLRRIAEESRQNLDSRMLCLSCLVNSIPLLGLLATAWGLLAAFGASQASEISTSIATAQPNIGTSLSLSVLALLVAIPAGIGMRLLRDQLQRKSREVRLFCEELDASILNSYPGTSKSSTAEVEDETPEADQAAPASAPAQSVPAPAPSVASSIAPTTAAVAKPKDADHRHDTDHGIAIDAATAVSTPPAIAATIRAALGKDSVATDDGEQLTFDTGDTSAAAAVAVAEADSAEEDHSDLDLEPSINPIARQAAKQAPDLLAGTQV